MIVSAASLHIDNCRATVARPLELFAISLLLLEETICGTKNKVRFNEDNGNLWNH